MKRCDKSLCPNYKSGTCYQAECNLKEIQEKELNDLAAKYVEEDIKAAEKAAETAAAWVKETNRRRNKKRGK